MVIVYLKTGTNVQVRKAKTAHADQAFGLPGGRPGLHALVCKGDDGQVLAEFKLDDISGYMISDERASG